MTREISAPLLKISSSHIQRRVDEERLIVLFLALNKYLTPHDLKSALCIELYGLWVYLVLKSKYAVFELFLRVIREDRYGSLNDYGSGVHAVIHEMDSTS